MAAKKKPLTGETAALFASRMELLTGKELKKGSLGEGEGSEAHFSPLLVFPPPSACFLESLYAQHRHPDPPFLLSFSPHPRLAWTAEKS